MPINLRVSLRIVAALVGGLAAGILGPAITVIVVSFIAESVGGEAGGVFGYVLVFPLGVLACVSGAIFGARGAWRALASAEAKQLRHSSRMVVQGRVSIRLARAGSLAAIGAVGTPIVVDRVVTVIGPAFIDAGKVDAIALWSLGWASVVGAVVGARVGWRYALHPPRSNGGED